MLHSVDNDDPEDIQEMFDKVPKHSAREIVNLTDGEGNTALIRACMFGNLNALKRLVAEPFIHLHVRNNLGVNCVDVAAFQGRANVLEFLAYSGFDLNEEDNDGYRPIHRAAWGSELRHTEAMEVLLKRGIDWRQKSIENKNALQSAFSNYNTEKLIKKYWKAEIKKNKRAKKLAALGLEPDEEVNEEE